MVLLSKARAPLPKRGGRNTSSWTLMKNIRLPVYVRRHQEFHTSAKTMEKNHSPAQYERRLPVTKVTQNPMREHVLKGAAVSRTRTCTGNKAHLYQKKQNHMRPDNQHLAKQYVEMDEMFCEEVPNIFQILIVFFLLFFLFGHFASQSFYCTSPENK